MVAGGKASRGEDGMSRIGSRIAFSSSSDVLAILLWCSCLDHGYVLISYLFP